MTLRANITTTYRESADPPRMNKNVREEAADQGVLESDGTRKPMILATKAPDQGSIPVAKSGGNRSANRGNGPTPRAVDAFEHIPAKPSKSNQGNTVDKLTRGHPLNEKEGESMIKPLSPGYGPNHAASGSAASQAKPHPATARSEDMSQPAKSGRDTKVDVKKAESSNAGEANTNARASSVGKSSDQSLQSLAMSTGGRSQPPIEAKKKAMSEQQYSDNSQSVKKQSTSLPIAAKPRIHHADPPRRQSSQQPTQQSASAGKPDDLVEEEPEKPKESSNDADTQWAATSSDEGTMQKGLTAALQYGQPQEDETADGTVASGKMARHLQAEGVFGISPSGRNLGVVDFIRQKQFEYAMDQKSFTGDDLLQETEKAIYETLDSDQSTSVSKSLLRAAESVNAYRNQTVKTEEYADRGA